MLRHQWRSPRRAVAAGVAVLAVWLPCAGARADESAPAAAPTNASSDAPAAAAPDDGVVKTIAKKLGMATDPGQPQDFVIKARPARPEDYVPVGRKAFERDVKVKTPEELKAIDDDLEAVRARHDALRATFAPAAKAVAEAQAAKAAKAAEKSKKPPPTPPVNPQ
ncbi:MAG: hypothetical protein ACLQE9_07110 [Roseiarcus sp.]